jgi:hypothetical protein
MEFTDKALLKAFEQFVMEDQEKMTFGYFKGYLCKALVIQEMEKKQEAKENTLVHDIAVGNI